MSATIGTQDVLPGFPAPAWPDAAYCLCGAVAPLGTVWPMCPGCAHPMCPQCEETTYEEWAGHCCTCHLTLDAPVPGAVMPFCRACHGSGIADEYDWTTGHGWDCSVCQGTGRTAGAAL